MLLTLLSFFGVSTIFVEGLIAAAFTTAIDGALPRKCFAYFDLADIEILFDSTWNAMRCRALVAPLYEEQDDA